MKKQGYIIIGLLLVALFSFTVQGYSIGQGATMESGIRINIYEVNDLETPLYSYYQSDDEAYSLLGFSCPKEEFYIAHVRLIITDVSSRECGFTLLSLYSDGESQKTSYYCHADLEPIKWGNDYEPYISYTDGLTGYERSFKISDNSSPDNYIGVDHRYGAYTELNLYLSDGGFTDYGVTNIIIKDADNYAIGSFTITHNDVYENITNSHKWRYKRIEVNPNTDEVSMVLCLENNAEAEYVIPTGLKLNKSYGGYLIDSHGKKHTSSQNYIDLTTDYPNTIPPTSHTFVIHVNHKNGDVFSIPINLYNYNGTALYAQKIIKGTYIDYTLIMKPNESNSAVCTLVFACESDITAITFRVDVNNENDPIKGIALKPNSARPSIVYDRAYGESVYKGRFYPVDKYDSLNLYIVSEAENTSIKVVYSYEYSETVDKLCESYYEKNEQLRAKVEELKQEANKTIDNAIEQLPTYFEGEQAEVAGEFFQSVYAVPFILSMITLVISVCIVSYALFGKKE